MHCARSDCDSDSECQPGLVCMQRSGDEAVPGCIGTRTFGEDYCYNPNWDSPSPPGPPPAPTSLPTPNLSNAPTPPPTPTTYPELTFVGNPAPSTLGVCEGDCDKDSDCGPDMECFQRPGTETVSGCLGIGDSGTDYCALRLTANTLFLKGNNGSPAENFPLGLCEGGKRLYFKIILIMCSCAFV
jgi:hypothetical protein